MFVSFCSGMGCVCSISSSSAAVRSSVASVTGSCTKGIATGMSMS